MVLDLIAECMNEIASLDNIDKKDEFVFEIIEKDDAIAALNRLFMKVKKASDYIEGYDEGFMQGSRHRWIPTSKMLPINEGIEYMVCVNGKSGNKTYDHAVLPSGMIEDGKWYIDGIHEDSIEVLAWMPYPELYEE